MPAARNHLGTTSNLPPFLPCGRLRRCSPSSLRVPFDAHVSGRILVFVNNASDAGRPDASTDVVVLDMSWTPQRGGRPDMVSIRPALTSVLQRFDLFDGSLARLDAWAEAAELADRFTADGVTWWYRVRMIVRWDLHELMLWRHVLDEVAPRGRYRTIVVPAGRRALVDAARATGPSSAAPRVRTVGGATDQVTRLLAWVRRRASRGARGAIRRGIRLAHDVWHRMPKVARRDAILDARVDALRAQPHGVLAIASARFFQIIRSSGRDRFADPHLALVLERLAERGRPVVTVALALDHRNDADWTKVEEDDRLLPHSLLRRRWSDPKDDAIDSSDVAGRLECVAKIPLDVEGWDLGPSFGSIVAGYAGSWLDGQRRGLRRAQRLMLELQPSVLFIDHEGVRTLWLAAARRLGIPIVAVQHGVIHPNNPEYCHPPHPALVRPDTTCVFGPYERDLLVRQGGYDPATVVVTGSSRSNPDETGMAQSPDERAQVRSELGVADGDRLLVVSVAHNPVAGDLHSADMVARMLGGPLSGIHVVFKLHPQDRTQGPFEALLRGLARAGGYPSPRITVVRDFELYRLLRAADAHLGQYSTVLTDAVVAGTPNMIAVGLAFGDMLGYVEARVAVPVECPDDVRSFMGEPRAPEPDDRARFLDAHFTRGDATARIVAAINATETRSGAGASR